MNPSDGLSTALNEIRETLIEDNKLFASEIPLVDSYTSSQVYGQSLLNLPSDLRNKFIYSLVNRIAYTKFTLDYFENPLRELAGDELPLGAIGQDIYINPARGRVYNIDDFAGLLAKYEADIKTEYTEINFDVQYPVTIIRKELEKAFISWSDFETFLLNLSTSLYNGAYIDDYINTKMLVSNAYRNNAVNMEVVEISENPTQEELENLTTKLRKIYLDFKSPSTKHNAWKKVGGYGRSIISWSNPENIVTIISNELASVLDVKVLANAYNIDKADLKGKVYYVDSFDILDNNGRTIFDGSHIKALICDKRWFKIRDKSMFMDEFYNANNRSWQTYLNVIKSYNYSLFSNSLMLVDEIPEINIINANFIEESPKVKVNEEIILTLNTNPYNSTVEVTFETNNENVTIEKIDDKNIKVKGITAGSSTITATVNNQNIASVEVEVEE